MTMAKSVHSLRDLNLNLLVALDRLLATQNVRLASEACGVTPSAMSHTLAALRVLLGDKLLVRRGNEMLPTPRAEALAGPLAAALRSLEAALADPAPFDPRTTASRFTLAASDVSAITVLPPLLAHLNRAAPCVEVALLPYDRSRVEAALAVGDVDVALGPLLGSASAALRVRTLYTSEFVVAMRKGHPAARRPLDLDAYCSLGHVLVSVGGNVPSVVDSLLAKKRRMRRVAARVPYFLVAPELVAESDLVLTAPRQAVSRAASSLGLVLREPPLPLPRNKIAMYFHPRFEDSTPHRWFRDAMSRAVESIPHSL